jgi:hypothetical protein
MIAWQKSGSVTDFTTEQQADVGTEERKGKGRGRRCREKKGSHDEEKSKVILLPEVLLSVGNLAEYSPM